MERRSLWEETGERPEYPALEGDLDVDVAVVGGGIVGVTTAWLLKAEGRRVALVEVRRIGSGTTGRTTAKLTVGQGLVYARLERKHGPAAARVFAETNAEAIGQLGALARELGIDCDWEPALNYVYTESSGRLRDLEEEVEAMQRAGIEAALTTETELPFPVAGAIRVGGQAQFHPVKFLAGLAARIEGDGSRVCEGTRATGVRSGEPCVVETPSGRIRARQVVVATQLPFLDRGLHFARAHPLKSYAVSAPVDETAAPRGMYLSVDEPTRSLRSAPASGGARHLVVGGESGRPGGEEDTDVRFLALEAFAREHFGAEAELRWSAHDYVPVDGLPYIGPVRYGEERIHVATGFAKWGLTKGMIAARLLADAIGGRPGRGASLYDARRLSPRASAAGLATENARVARRFVEDRLRRREPEDVEAIAPGQGAVVRAGARQLAVYRDEKGVEHVLSARCPHLGCIVGWSEADRGWACPCHGSRFTGEGELLQGPATQGLARATLAG